MKALLSSLFVLALSVPFLAGAQDCKLKTEVDKFSRQQKISTGFMKFTADKATVSLNMVADAKEIRLLFSLGEGNCFDDASTAAFIFEGSRTKSNQKNTTAMNCDGIFTVVFRNGTTTPYILDKLTKVKLTSIEITGNSKQKTLVALTEEEKTALQQRVTCLVNEARKLIVTP